VHLALTSRLWYNCDVYNPWTRAARRDRTLCTSSEIVPVSFGVLSCFTSYTWIQLTASMQSSAGRPRHYSASTRHRRSQRLLCVRVRWLQGMYASNSSVCGENRCWMQLKVPCQYTRVPRRGHAEHEMSLHRHHISFKFVDCAVHGRRLSSPPSGHNDGW